MFWWVTLDAPFGGTRSPWVVLVFFFTYIHTKWTEQETSIQPGWSQKKARNLRGNRFPVAARAPFLSSHEYLDIKQGKAGYHCGKNNDGNHLYVVPHVEKEKPFSKPSFWGYRLIFNGAPSFCGRWISKYKTIGSQVFRRTYPSWQPMKIDGWKMKFPFNMSIFRGHVFFLGGCVSCWWDFVMMTRGFMGGFLGVCLVPEFGGIAWNSWWSIRKVGGRP